ncbi:MAG: GlxA family transcriptional regulator [Aestuariibacter sp.]
MKTINILCGDNCVGSSLVALIDFVQFSNTFWKFLHPNCDEPVFAYKVYSASGESVTFSNGIIVPAIPVAVYQPADAVCVVSGFARDKQALTEYLHTMKPFMPILQSEKQKGALIASYCTGTFVLAHSGILASGPATTVWWLKNVFTGYFPEIQLTMDELVVEHENVITGGATTSHFNVFMRLAEKLSNEIFITQLSKLLLLDKHRLSQQPFIDNMLMINKHDELVEDVQDWMMQHFAESISLDEICEQFAVSKRTLIRRFKNACGETPLNFLQKVRVEKAKHYLETTNLPIERIVEKVGYEDSASFRKLFANTTQLSPKAYRERFSYHPSMQFG